MSTKTIAQHSAGPWRLIDSNGSSLIVTADGRLLFNPTETTAEERAANASLIAAAPELLAICKELRAALEDMFHATTLFENARYGFAYWAAQHTANHGIGHRAEAVIAKAEGRDA